MEIKPIELNSRYDLREQEYPKINYLPFDKIVKARISIQEYLIFKNVSYFQLIDYAAFEVEFQNSYSADYLIELGPLFNIECPKFENANYLLSQQNAYSLFLLKADSFELIYEPFGERTF